MFSFLLKKNHIVFKLGVSQTRKQILHSGFDKTSPMIINTSQYLGFGIFSKSISWIGINSYRYRSICNSQVSVGSYYWHYCHGSLELLSGAYRGTQRGGGLYWEKSTVFVRSLTKCPKRRLGGGNDRPPTPLNAYACQLFCNHYIPWKAATFFLTGVVSTLIFLRSLICDNTTLWVRF